MSPLALTLGEWFGISRSAARVAVALFDADTRPLTVAEIGERAGMRPPSVRAALVALRQAMEPGEIVTDGLRYAFTEAGMDDCNRAILDALSRRAA